MAHDRVVKVADGIIREIRPNHLEAKGEHGTVFVVYVFRFFGIAAEITRALGIGLSDFWAALRGSIALGCCEMVLVRVADMGIPGWAGWDALRLAVDFGAGTTLFVAAIAIAPKWVLGEEAFQVVQSMSSRLPNRLRQIIPQLNATAS